MKKLLGGNWKLNGSLDLIEKFSAETSPSKNLDMFIAVPFPYIPIASKKFNCDVGAQTCSGNYQGAFTGEVNAMMIKECGASYVLVGHSECRNDGDRFSKTISNCLKAGLNIVYCVGESLKDRENGTYLDVIKDMLLDLYSVLTGKDVICDDDNIDRDDINEKISNYIEPGLNTKENDAINGKDYKKIHIKETIINIAYEPVWSIGTGIVPEISQIKEVVNFIKGMFVNKFNIRVIYGGSVKRDNCKTLIMFEGLDGFLVGAASLTSEFFEIAKVMDDMSVME